MTNINVCSIRIRQGLLTVITFRDNNSPESKWTPMVGDGFIVLDISKYNTCSTYLSIVLNSIPKKIIFFVHSVIDIR